MPEIFILFSVVHVKMILTQILVTLKKWCNLKKKVAICMHKIYLVTLILVPSMLFF